MELYKPPANTTETTPKTFVIIESINADGTKSFEAVEEENFSTRIKDLEREGKSPKQYGQPLPQNMVQETLHHLTNPQ